jgi:hypothetical protein
MISRGIYLISTSCVLVLPKHLPNFQSKVAASAKVNRLPYFIADWEIGPGGGGICKEPDWINIGIQQQGLRLRKNRIDRWTRMRNIIKKRMRKENLAIV